MKQQKRIAVAAEKSSAYGRNFIRGVAEAAEQHPEWDIVLIDPMSIAAKAKEPFDGWICRVADRRAASALSKGGRPVVDCLCESDSPRLCQRQDRCGRYRTPRGGASCPSPLRTLRLLRIQSRRLLRQASKRIRNVSGAEGIPARRLPPAVHAPEPIRKRLPSRNACRAPPDSADLAAWIKRLPKPVGMFCCDDLRASQVLSQSRKLGLAVPGDVAIIGVDDDPINCMFSTPRLSSIDPDAVTIGRTAADTMALMLSGRKTAADPPRIVVPPRGIVERENCSA